MVPDKDFPFPGWGVALLLFLAAFALRIAGVNYGYFHGDEGINAAARVLTGELVPGQHFYPPLIHYQNAVSLVGLFAIGLGLDWWDGTAAFRAQYFADPTAFYIAARVMTALSGALLAPLFYLIARRLRLSLPLAALVGGFAVLYPLGVYMSHIAKGDTALATAMVAVIWAYLARFDTDRPWRWDIWLGIFVVLAVSYKHSVVFILAPLFLSWLGFLIRAEGLGAAMRSLLRAFVTVALLWPVLNIGIVLDFQNFLAFQEIQAVMSIRMEDGPIPGLTTATTRILSLVLGLGPFLTALTIAVPALLLRKGSTLPLRPQLMAVWLSLVIGTVILAVMVGPRQPEHLWIANFAGFLLLVGVILADWIKTAEGQMRGVGKAATALSLALLAYGTWQPVAQATARPLHEVTDLYIAEAYEDEHLLTMVEIGLPQRMEAQAMVFERWERLAARYDVELPETAPERILTENAPDAVFYIPLPNVFFGLEGVDEEAEGYEVQAHAWPPQREEWQLDYWLEREFNVILVSNLDYQLHGVESQLMRDFFAELVSRCPVEASFEASKPLYLERDVTIFHCQQGA